jgi:BlaI family transcriptional regulator, penicillinase repressor
MKLEKLTDCEELVMKTVWDAEEELSLMEVMSRVNEKYKKNWKPQTVSTFLARLVKKGYLRHYRQGRVFFYQILVPLDTYKGQLTNDYVNFWNHSNADEFLCALAEERPLRQDEVERIQKLIDGMDN